MTFDELSSLAEPENLAEIVALPSYIPSSKDSVEENISERESQDTLKSYGEKFNLKKLKK